MKNLYWCQGYFFLSSIEIIKANFPGTVFLREIFLGGKFRVRNKAATVPDNIQLSEVIKASTCLNEWLR